MMTMKTTMTPPQQVGLTFFNHNAENVEMELHTLLHFVYVLVFFAFFAGFSRIFFKCFSAGKNTGSLPTRKFEIFWEESGGLPFQHLIGCAIFSLFLQCEFPPFSHSIYLYMHFWVFHRGFGFIINFNFLFAQQHYLASSSSGDSVAEKQNDPVFLVLQMS